MCTRLRSTRGQSTMEYAIVVAAIIAVIAVVAVRSIQPSVDTVLTDASGKISSALR